MNELNMLNDTPAERPVTLNQPADGAQAAPKTTSLAQLAANRANALKSTGPKTPGGLAVSKMNALKHGFFSREVLVRGVSIKESRRQLAALHDRFRQSCNPHGPLEELLLEQIVTAYWRTRRALRAESGEIALSVDQGHWQRTRRKPHWFWMEPEGQLEPAPDPVSEMSESAAGNAIMAGWLSEVRAQVEQEGELTEPATKIPFSGRPNSLSRKLQRLRVVLSQNSGADNPASQREANKQQALRAIDLKLQQLQSCEAACAKREAADEAARQDAAVLPSPDVLDKIMRYETTLQRQMYRAMSQLERLQRMRHGEAVPAPIMMELSERAWSQKCIFAKRTQNAEVASGS